MVGFTASALALPARPPATAPTAPPTAPPTGPATAPPTAAPAAPPVAAPAPTPTGCAPGAPVRGSRLASRSAGCFLSRMSASFPRVARADGLVDTLTVDSTPMRWTARAAALSLLGALAAAVAAAVLLSRLGPPPAADVARGSEDAFAPGRHRPRLSRAGRRDGRPVGGDEAERSLGRLLRHPCLRGGDAVAGGARPFGVREPPRDRARRGRRGGGRLRARGCPAPSLRGLRRLRGLDRGMARAGRGGHGHADGRERFRLPRQQAGGGGRGRPV